MLLWCSMGAGLPMTLTSVHRENANCTSDFSPVVGSSNAQQQVASTWRALIEEEHKCPYYNAGAFLKLMCGQNISVLSFFFRVEQLYKSMF